VAIANALQLEAARATPVLYRFNYDVMPSLKSLILSIAVLYCFATDTLLYAVTLTFDLLMLSFYSISGVMRLNSVQNFSKIE